MGKDVDGACCDACRQFGDQSALPDVAPTPDLRATHERVRIRVSEKGGEPFEFQPTGPEVSIGRVQGNDIVLPKGNVSKRASRIVFKDGKAIVVDLKSSCGTYVNGRKITAPTVLAENATVYIGDFVLTLVRAE